MNKLISLPTEVVLEVRTFLFPNELQFSRQLYHYDDFILKENCWSWRNFLSVSNRPEWRLTRHDAMIWSLNKYQIKKYMEDDSFRSLINLRSATTQKLQLVLPDFRCYSFTHLKTSLDTSCIGFISISSYELAEFPSCKSVHTLILQSFNQKLTSLGSYENLKILELSGGLVLSSIGMMQKLLFLCLDGIGSSCLFPLEQLISFQLLSDNGKFVHIQHRFLLLEHLRLNIGSSFALSTHCSALNKLKSLSLSNYQTVNLSGLQKLTILSVHLVTNLLGMDELLPQLIKVQGDISFLNCPQLKLFVDHYTPSDLSVTQLHKCLQLPVVRMSLFNGSVQLPESNVIIGEKLKDLQISGVHVRSFESVLPGRYFNEIMICDNQALTDVSVFVNAQKVFLWDCPSISDISPLRTVPYLVIGSCSKIEDYSCLGSQQYLEIVQSDSLLDEHLQQFGKIRCLKIGSCSRITRIDKLTYNRFIKISNCSSLQEVVLVGFDYAEVRLSGCTNLTSVSILGWVDSLNINACSPKMTKQSIKNYTYLDFQT
jgi:hypothetical protein